MNEKYIQSLRDAIQKKHGCISRYAQTVAVKEEADGALPEWQGNVEVFDLANHPQARQCYAWSYKDDTGRLQYVTVLSPPIKSAAEAVRSHLQNQAMKDPPL
jgi:hypothetical protein